MNEGARGRGAPEFFLFSNAIAPWQPADSVAIVKLMALQLNGHIAVRGAAGAAVAGAARGAGGRHPARRAGAGHGRPARYAALFPEMPRLRRDAGPPRPARFLSPVAPPDLAGASNAWAAGPSRSATGGTLLANDPHLRFTAPSIWYLARLELPSGGVIGGTIPGVPVVLIGRSARLGWGDHLVLPRRFRHPDRAR